MTTSYNLLERINAKKAQPKVPVRMSPFVRRLNEKRLPAKALWNGAYTPSGSDGAA